MKYFLGMDSKRGFGFAIV